MTRSTRCPGSGEPWAAHTLPIGDGLVTCSRCGGLYRTRADGKVRHHRVDPRIITPSLREPAWLRRARHTGRFPQSRRAR